MSYLLNPFRFGVPQLVETIYVYSETGTNRLAISTNIQDWDDYDIGSFRVRDSVYSEELGLFVVCGQFGGSGAIAISNDGINYTQPSIPSVGTLMNGITWSPSLGLFAACTNNGSIITSPDGTTWTSRTSATTDGLNKIDWSESLGLFLAVGGGATNFRTTRSTDGTSWTAANDTSRNRARNVYWSEDEEIFLILHNCTTATQTAISSSTNGTSFTTRLSINATGNIRGITYSPSLNLFVAVSNDLTNRVYTSPNGTTWTSRTAATQQPWQAVDWSEKHNLFLAVSLGASSAANAFMTSSNGINWTSLEAPDNIEWGSIIVREGELVESNIGTFIATSTDGTNRLMKSLDGINWTAITGGDNSGQWISIAWAKDKGIITAVDANRGTTSKIMYSTNGTTWNTSTIDASDVNFNAIVYSPSLGKFSTVANAGTNRVYYSTNGINFTAGSISSRNWSSLIWAEGFGLFIAGGRTGGSNTPAIIATSSDGETYTDRYTSAGNDNNVALGYSPTLGTSGRAVGLARRAADTGRYSDNGTTWTSTITHPRANTEAIAWSPTLSIFVAVATGAVSVWVMTSTDGITWTTRTPAENNVWQNVEWSDYLQMFVAISGGGTNRVMYSTNGTSWTSASAAEANLWRGLTYTNGLIF